MRCPVCASWNPDDKVCRKNPLDLDDMTCFFKWVHIFSKQKKEDVTVHTTDPVITPHKEMDGTVKHNMPYSDGIKIIDK